MPLKDSYLGYLAHLNPFAHTKLALVRWKAFASRPNFYSLKKRYKPAVPNGS